MTQLELKQLKEWLTGEVERRRPLGGYNQDAESMLNLFEVAAKLADHLYGVEKRIKSAARKHK
jgi:hypothetical protein